MNINPQTWSVKSGLALMALTLIILFFKSARAAGPWYVAPGGSDGNACLSAGTPCATINGAIGKASSGDTLFVAIGIYTTSIGTEVVFINKTVTVSGGWEATFTTQNGMSTIDGQSARRGIYVNAGVTATIEQFVIQNGAADNSGGGIHTDGSLTVNNSNISSNTVSGLYATGGGIFNGTDGILTLNDSQISDNEALPGGGNAQGGGLYNNGTLILNHILVSGNSAESGGGINNNYGTLSLTNSSVSDNSANGGGGIWVMAGSALLKNSTVNSNTATGGAGGIINSSSLNLVNSTVSGNISLVNGGGIVNYSSLSLNNSAIISNTSQQAGGLDSTSGATLQNSILAGNTSTGSGPDCYGTLTSLGYNLIQDTTDCTITGTTTGNVLGVDPLLGPLQDNGGSTITHALLPGSPAIDAGNPTGCADHLAAFILTDQRGRPRPGRCDIGAFELTALLYLPLLRR